MLVIDRLLLRLLFIILMTVMMTTAPMIGDILLNLLMSLNTVVPQMHPACRVPQQEGSNCEKAR